MENSTSGLRYGPKRCWRNSKAKRRIKNPGQSSKYLKTRRPSGSQQPGSGAICAVRYDVIGVSTTPRRWVTRSCDPSECNLHFPRACSRSCARSWGSSHPTERRTRFWPMSSFSRCSSATTAWVSDEGCCIRLSTLPRLTAK